MAGFELENALKRKEICGITIGEVSVVFIHEGIMISVEYLPILV